MQKKEDLLERYFHLVVSLRWLIVILGAVLVMVAMTALPSLTKDTSAGAFIDPENPALRYREQAEELFGLRDPIVVAVVNEGSEGVFNPASLQLIDWLTKRISALDNVDPERVISLSTESNVIGTEMGMEVRKFLEPLPITQAEALAVRQAVSDFPLYQGSLVARDGRASLVVVEILNEDQAQQTYNEIMQLVSVAPIGTEDVLLVAGEGAVAGYLSSYIDQDAQRLNPFAALIITLILFLGFRTLRATLLPNVVILATAVITLGVMATTATPFYVITNGLIVCMIGVAVADSIHVLSQYYERQQREPKASQRELVVSTMRVMVRPVTLTSITTVAGFLALYPTSSMPPIKAFGLFGALAVCVAWAYTVTVLPAMLSFFKPRPSKSFVSSSNSGGKSFSHRFMVCVGAAVLKRPRIVVAVSLAIVVIGILGVARVQIEDQRIENFKSSEPLYHADKRINNLMDGTYHLDVLVEVQEEEGLHDPARLRKIQALQNFLESQPHVNGSTSVVDYIKQMNRAVNENQTDQYAIPDDRMLVAQLFLLYATSGNPTDFEQEIDTTHRQALVRAYLDTNAFANNRQLVPLVEAYLVEQFNEPGMTAKLTGRVHVDYHWINGIAESHAGSVLVSTLAVLVMATVLFRSFSAGFLTVIPVAMSILLIYAVMGFFDIWLGIGTSMFAAIAIGLGVDFSIHSVERMRQLGRQSGHSLTEALSELYPTTGRALLLNLAAVALGFGVLCLSDVPPLIRFGGLVGLAVSASFIASITLLPCLILLLKPASIIAPHKQQGVEKNSRAPVAILAIIMLGGLHTQETNAAERPDGLDIMRSVASRDEGFQVTRNMRLELIDRRGQTRTQEIKAYRRYFGDEKRTLLFYTAPANVRGTGFLTYDYFDRATEDDQWLYLPALRKVRRIPASNRGDYFLGTDFSYEEIKSENKIGLQDYDFRTVGEEEVNGIKCYVVEGIAINAEIVSELGYSKAVWRIDPTIWISRKSDYWDINGNHLKTIENLEIKQIDEVWTVLQVKATNHKSGHSTVLTNLNVDYQSDIPERTFEQRTLQKGL